MKREEIGAWFEAVRTCMVEAATYGDYEAKDWYAIWANELIDRLV